MADKRIQDLTPASSVQTADRFVLEQSGQAKSLTGQILINDLAAFLDGHGGISDISYTAPSSGSLTGTLTITLADETVETFTVTNGKGISSITKTAGTGTNLTDTYTITYNDNTTYTFTLDNGKSIASIADKWAVSDSNSTAPSTWYNDPQTMTVANRYEWHYQIITFNDGTTLSTDQAVVGVYGDTGDADHVYIKWADAYPTQDADMLNYPSNYIGVCTTTADTAPTSYADYEWFLYKGSTGDTGNGIVSVTLDSSSGLVDTYKVLFDDNTYTTFNVTNGSDIDSITKTSSSGLTDTYTVLLTNGDATTFQVVNGKSITSITNVDVTHVAGHTDVYQINFNDGDTFSFSIYNGTNGSGSVSTVDGIQSDGNQNVPLLLLGSNAPTTSTVGVLKQRYFDQTNSNLYICTGIDTSGAETTYTWQGATSITVDSSLSTLSTNPVQNAVLTTLLGTTVLNTTAQTLTGAVNELDGKIGVTALPTTAQTITGAIAELDGDVSGKVSKSGDTMTGNLTLQNHLYVKNTANAVGDTPSTNSDRYINFTDKNNTIFGNFRSRLYTNNRVGLSFGASRTVNNTSVSNGAAFIIDSSGNSVVAFDHPEAVRAGLALGTSGAFPLTILQGGTGYTGIESINSTNLFTIGSGYTLVEAYGRKWGKIMAVYVSVKKTAAVTTEGWMYPGSFTTDNRPVLTNPITCYDSAIPRAYISSSGSSNPGRINAYGTWAANATKTFGAIIMLP